MNAAPKRSSRPQTGSRLTKSNIKLEKMVNISGSSASLFFLTPEFVNHVGNLEKCVAYPKENAKSKDSAKKDHGNKLAHARQKPPLPQHDLMKHDVHLLYERLWLYCCLPDSQDP